MFIGRKKRHGRETGPEQTTPHNTIHMGIDLSMVLGELWELQKNINTAELSDEGSEGYLKAQQARRDTLLRWVEGEINNGRLPQPPPDPNRTSS